MRFLTLGLSLAIFTGHAAAQEQTAPKTLEFEGREWRVAAKEAEIVNHLGREAVTLMRGRLWDDDARFGDGVISFDVAYEEEQLFAGAGWRAESPDHFEMMYVRGHLNNKPDALQYTPVENGLSAWQIFGDENSIAPVSQKFDNWNNVKIVIIGDRADIYFNSDTPSLHVPDLKTDLEKGGVSLGVSGKGSIFLSNIEIRPLRKGEKIIGEPKKTPAPPDGMIANWSISSPFDESSVANALTIPERLKSDLAWNGLRVETNGVANIAKLRKIGDKADTVFARLNIKSDKAQMKEMRFGYSDRVRLYLNGKRVYYGDAGWRVRDYRFLGTVGFFDSAGLDLKKGDNELMVAISETFGGWAWAGAIQDQTGITLEN
ncbi:MAG: hypothetical protein R3C60_06715 [Parvularculaceae bacterium]